MKIQKYFKKSFKIIELFRKSKEQILIFSGNLSFLFTEELGKKIIDIFEETLKRNVYIKVVCRINYSSMENLNKIRHLFKYKNFELRHNYQPLRGFLVDENTGQFSEYFFTEKYKTGELEFNTQIIYSIKDEEWINWLQQVFWSLFRKSISYEKRVKEIERIIP